MADSSTLPRIAIPILLFALAGAGAYISHLRGRIATLEQGQGSAAAPAPRPAEAARAAGAPAAPAAAPAAASATDVLTAEQEQAMGDVLRGEIDSGRKVWFLIHQSNPETAGIQAEIGAVFELAGWPVEVQRYPAPLKAGITVLAADETPPSFVNTASDALDAARIDTKLLTGYRDYFNGKKADDPNWRGPELAADQPFVIVIGSKPTLKATE
jgi:hypothetical protein